MDSPATLSIYVRLLDEGTDVWRPVAARPIDGEWFEICAEQSVPEDEQWEFLPGAVVRCQLRQLSGGARLVAETSRGGIV